jgi:hypothetical protein
MCSPLLQREAGSSYRQKGTTCASRGVMPADRSVHQAAQITANRRSSTARFLSSFMTRSQNLAPSLCSIHRPRRACGLRRQCQGEGASSKGEPSCGLGSCRRCRWCRWPWRRLVRVDAVLHVPVRPSRNPRDDCYAVSALVPAGRTFVSDFIISIVVSRCVRSLGSLCLRRDYFPPPVGAVALFAPSQLAWLLIDLFRLVLHRRRSAE